MKKILMIWLALLLVLSLAGCSKESNHVAFSEKDVSSVSLVRLNNAHNGQSTMITDKEQISQICGFLQTLSGEASKEQEGFYEGSYTVTLMDAAETVLLEVIFGDTDVFSCNIDGAEGTVRFDMAGATAKQVIAFFSQYDTSGFQWK